MDRKLNGTTSSAYLGVNAPTPPNLVIIPRAPTQYDYKSFYLGDLWLDNSRAPIVSTDVYMLVDMKQQHATWVNFTAGNALLSLSGELGGPVFPDGAHNISIVAEPVNIQFVGIPLTHELELRSSGGGPLLETITGTDAIAVQPDGNGNFNLTSATPGVTITNTAGHTLSINVPGAPAGTVFTTDNLVATPAAGNINILTQRAALGCGSSVLFSAPGAASTIQLNVTDTNNNTIIGHLAGNLALTGTHTTVLGQGAAVALTTGSNNTIIGDGAGTGLTTSSNNTIIGYHAAQGLATGAPNIVIGSGAGANMAAADYHNLVIGNAGIAGKHGFVCIGGHGGSVWLHNYPGQDATTVNGGNIFVGDGAGNFTLTNLGTDASNNGFGGGCLQSLTTGTNNDVMGTFTLRLLTTGYSNVAIGHSAGYNSGANAGVTTGTDNVLLGYETGSNYTGAESGNILIGSAALAANQTSGVAGESNVTKIANIRGVTTNVVDAIPVLIDSAFQLGTVSSSIRFKENIEDMADSSSPVLDLRPVTFEYKKHPGHKQYGLIAEEVEKIMPRLVAYDKDGLPETVKYHELPAILLNEVKKLVKRVEELESKLNLKG